MKEFESKLLKVVGELIGQNDRKIEAVAKEIPERIEKVAAKEMQAAATNYDLYRIQQLEKAKEFDTHLNEIVECFALQKAELEETTAKLQQAEQLLVDLQRTKFKHAGGYRPGFEYTQGDAVTRDMSTFVCVAEKTTADPNDKTDDWRLLAGRGEKGNAGKEGPRGPRGEKGARGRDGEDGSQVVTFEAHANPETGAAILVLALSDNQVFHVDLSEFGGGNE